MPKIPFFSDNVQQDLPRTLHNSRTADICHTPRTNPIGYQAVLFRINQLQQSTPERLKHLLFQITLEYAVFYAKSIIFTDFRYFAQTPRIRHIVSDQTKHIAEHLLCPGSMANQLKAVRLQSHRNRIPGDDQRRHRFNAPSERSSFPDRWPARADCSSPPPESPNPPHAVSRRDPAADNSPESSR